MNDKHRQWVIELLWVVVSVVITGLFMLPILESGINFPWFMYNVVYLFGALTLIRYIFLFHDHPLATSKIFKILLIFAVPILFFPIIEGLHSFIEFLDREGLPSLMNHLTPKQQSGYSSYIKVEYLLSAVTCFVGAFALIVKMIRSLWRQVKYGQV